MVVQKNILNMNNALEQLNEQFSIDDSVVIKQSRQNDLLYIEIKNDCASATIQLQGAHLTAWTPNNSVAVIWLSEQAKFDQRKSIRGGIPICWPWFGDNSTNNNLPAHGFARTVLWQIEAIEIVNPGETKVILSLPKKYIPTAQWPLDTQVECIFTIGQTLELELVTHNNSKEEMQIGEALHTYFNVSNVENILIDGLDECEYLDKLDNFKRKTQSGNIEIKQEIDRVYIGTNQDCTIEDLGFNRRIIISKKGSMSTIIWNPWLETAKKMGDLGKDGYSKMICVESGNAATDAVSIKPDKKHSLIVRYSVEQIT